MTATMDAAAAKFPDGQVCVAGGYNDTEPAWGNLNEDDDTYEINPNFITNAM